MAASKRERLGDSVALALARGSTVAEAARTCGVAESTVHRWLKEEPFRSQIRQLRGSILGPGIGRALDEVLKSVETFTKVRDMEQADPRVRLDAAKALIDTALKGRQHLDWEDRWKALEAATDAGH